MVAGYLSTHERWLVFAKDWADAIADLCLPYFHMEPCISGRDTFKGIGVEFRDELMRTIFPLIPANTEFGISEGVDLGDFEEAVLRNVPKRQDTKDLRDPYFLCFQLALERIVFRAEQHVSGFGPDDEIVCFFERQDEFGCRALRYFSGLKADEKNRPWVRRLRAPTFEPKEKYVPLQAADVLAWLSNRFMAGHLKHPRFPVEEYLRILWERGTLEHGVLNRAALQQEIARFRAEGKLPR